MNGNIWLSRPNGDWGCPVVDVPMAEALEMGRKLAVAFPEREVRVTAVGVPPWVSGSKNFLVEVVDV